MPLAIASSAWSWPMTRSSRCSFSSSTVWISSLTMRPTGMPVQLATTSADRLLVDVVDQRVARPGSPRAWLHLRSAVELALRAAPQLRPRRPRLRPPRRPPRPRPRPRPDRLPVPASAQLAHRRLAPARALRPGLLQASNSARSFFDLDAPRSCARLAAGSPMSMPTPSPRVDLSSIRAARVSIDLGRRALWLMRDAGAGGVEQADPLSGSCRPEM